jgi:Sugar (and other) transporter
MVETSPVSQRAPLENDNHEDAMETSGKPLITSAPRSGDDVLHTRTLVGAVAVGMPFVLTLDAQQVLGYSAVKFGVGSVVLAVAVAVGVIVAQTVVLRVGFRPVAATGMALLGAGSLLLTQVAVGGSYLGDIFVGRLVSGLGIGLAFVTATVAALAGVAEHVAGIVMALALLLLGRPRHAPQERLEAVPVPIQSD